MRPDSHLVSEIEENLFNDLLLRGCEIRLKAENGVVTLSGSVDRLYKKISAEALAVRVDGVIDVINKINIRPWQFVKNKDFEALVSNFDIADTQITTSGA